ncbi:MAG: translation elongation factor Ts [Pseudomonadales bacterium]|nr:translation elongation factor Ts [Pseudomonadales bacterium]
MSYTVADIKKLREETGARMMDCKKALEAAKGDYQEALKFVKETGLARAEKKSDRETKEGYIASYVHSNNKVAALVEILCETDFVARNAEFQQMAKDVAMHVVAMNPENIELLMEDQFIKDPSITVEELVKGVSGKIGEKFVVNRFVRYELGK